MANSFTTSFTFNGNDHGAVITQRADSLAIYVPDDSLHDIIPKGKEIIDMRLGYRVDNVQFNQRQQLVLAILKSFDFDNITFGPVG